MLIRWLATDYFKLIAVKSDVWRPDRENHARPPAPTAIMNIKKSEFFVN
jgi:hypothetical protein